MNGGMTIIDKDERRAGTSLVGGDEGEKIGESYSLTSRCGKRLARGPGTYLKTLEKISHRENRERS